MPRKDLSISEKIAILELIKKQPSNTSQRRLAEITGVPKSTVARIVQQQHELTLYKKCERRLSQKRKRECKDPDVEEALGQWFTIVSTQGIHVTGPVLRRKSEEFAKKLGHNDFKATSGWLSRWKSRFGIKKLYGKGNAEQWNAIKLPNLLKNFDVKDIYNNNNNYETSEEQKDEDNNTPEYETVLNQEVINHVDGLPYLMLEENYWKMSDLSLQRKTRAPMKYRKHTEASKRKLLEAYTQRKNWKAVAIAYDMPLRTAQRIIATGSVKTKPRGGARYKKFSKEMKQYLIQALEYNRKLTFQEMSSIILCQFQIKVSPQCVAYNLKEMRNPLKMQDHTIINSSVNIEKPDLLPPGRKRRKLISYEMVKTAQQMVNQGKRNREIQKILNLSKNATINLVKKITERGDEFVKNYNPSPQRNSTPLLRDQEVKRKIEMYLNADPSLTQNGILEKLRKDGIITSQPQISRILKSMDGYLRETRIEQGVEESRNEKLLQAMQYQITPQTQSKLQQKINISAALGKPANTERSRKSPLDTASTSNSTLATKPIEVEDSSPPIKKAREIHIDIDTSEDESTVVSKPPLQPAIPVESPVQKSVTTSVKPTPVVHNPVLDINVPQKQKRILVVPNHQQSVMSNLSSLWKAGRLCDAFISNGTTNLKVHKMILGSVCPKVLDLFYITPQHKLPKVTFPSSVSKEALLAFAEYMYNGALDLDPDMLTQMKVIAKQLDMKDFEQLCNNQLKTTVVQDIQPTILEPMLSEPCSSSGLLQQMSLENNRTSVMDIISAPTRSHQKNVHAVNALNALSSTTNNSNSSFSNLPLVEIRAETNDFLMEAGINNIVPSIVHNTCDININNRLLVKTEEVDPDDQQYVRETISSNINYSTPDSIIINNITHFSNSNLSKSSSSLTSTTQPTNSTLNKPLPVGHIWKQNNKDDGNLTKNANPTDPYPINLFTANWSNVPLLTQEIKKEYSVD